MVDHVLEYVMPEYVAPYAMYGEDSGDSDMEAAYDEWMKREIEFHGFTSFHFVGTKEDGGFMRYHELHDFGIGSCDTETFIFHANGGKV